MLDVSGLWAAELACSLLRGLPTPLHAPLPLKCFLECPLTLRSRSAQMLCLWVMPFCNRPLADGTVHCGGSDTYQICFRLPIPNPNLTLNPNPIADPNPNPKNNKKENDTGMKLNTELYLKVDFVRKGLGL